MYGQTSTDIQNQNRLNILELIIYLHHHYYHLLQWSIALVSVSVSVSLSLSRSLQIMFEHGALFLLFVWDWRTVDIRNYLLHHLCLGRVGMCLLGLLFCKLKGSRL